VDARSQVMAKVPLGGAAWAEGRYVILHDDDHSPMATVITWAAQTFEIDAAEAAVKVASVHKRGWVAFGPFTEDDVEQRLARGHAVARELEITALGFDTTLDAP